MALNQRINFARASMSIFPRSQMLWGLLVLSALLFNACTIEGSDNGDLDGMWRLQAIDSLENGKHNAMEGQRIYWNFQKNLLQFTDINHVWQPCLLRFAHANGHLLLSEPYLYDRLDNDKPVGDTFFLRPFGMNALQEEFQIETLTGSRMVLRSETLRLHFRKF